MIDYFETKSQPITRLMVWQAYKEVRANKGSYGVDGMDWGYLETNVKTELYKLWNRLASGSYFPKPVKQVAIPKKDGGERLLGIPTILDRVAQQVVKYHLEKVLEPIFHADSYGYRPHRNAHQAVEKSNSRAYNHDFAIDLDIKGFFDNIDHELLQKALVHYCKEKWVLMYVKRWLDAGLVAKDGQQQPTIKGTPQGGVMSPLLANLYLHVVFDKWMEQNHPEKPFERYAELELHPSKTKIVNLRGISVEKYPKGYDFLGFSIHPS